MREALPVASIQGILYGIISGLKMTTRACLLELVCCHVDVDAQSRLVGYACSKLQPYLSMRGPVACCASLVRKDYSS